MLGRLRFVEIQSGFSRASRSPATRRLAKLAPLASAREQLLHHYRNQESVAPYTIRELQNRQKPAVKQTQTNNDFLYAPRHYAASGLLNLQTTLMRTMIRTTPGVKLLSHEDRASRSQKQMNFAFSRPIEVC
jgi:hypothetical protein